LRNGAPVVRLYALEVEVAIVAPERPVVAAFVYYGRVARVENGARGYG
jgi:hypothetical protein